MSRIRAFTGVLHHSICTPQAIAIEDDFSSYSYARLVQDAKKTVSALSSLGLGQSDRVAIVAMNRYEYVVLLLAALLGGPILVPVNRRVSTAEMVYILEHSLTKCIVADPEVLQALGDYQSLNHCQRFALPTNTVVTNCVDNGGDPENLELLKNQPQFLEWVTDFVEAEVSVDCDPQRVYLQIYTSGTSGKPKGVMLSEDNCLGQTMALLFAFDVPLSVGSTLYEGLPLFHVGGIFISIFALSRGASLHYAQNFSPIHVNSLIETGTVQHVVLVPAMIQACLTAASELSQDFSRLKTIMYGASPISETALRAAKERYKCDFLQVYGMTETHSLISMLSAADHARIFSGEASAIARSAGRAVPGTLIEIVGENGELKATGEVGEIRVASQHVMKAYWLNKEATEEAVKNGYLYTGDVGYVDGDGFLFVVDRIKDIIVTGGENVSSLEVESAMQQHENVVDCAVIGTPDVRWGEAVTAILVTKDSNLTADDFIKFGKSVLAGFKAPKRIEMVDALPRNANGKVLKMALRKQFSE